MAGLINSSTGLFFGTDLQFQTQIGAAGLDVTEQDLWYTQYALPDGTLPSVAMDFVNAQFYDGSSGDATLASMVGGNPTIDAGGMLCNSTNISAIGALLDALKSTTKTIAAVVSGGTQNALGGLVSFENDAPLFKMNTNKLRNFNGASSTSLDTGNTVNWTNYVWTATGVDASGRDLCMNTRGVVSDSSALATVTTVQMGSYQGGLTFGGRMRLLLVYPQRVAAATLVKLTRPPPFDSLFAGDVGVNFSEGQSLNAGSVLSYERTQPWSAWAVIQVGQRPSGAGIIFSNVTNGSPYRGYEFWINPSGQLQVRIINTYASNYIGVIGSTNVCDGQWHVVGATYDGSSTAAGVKFYIDGVQDLSNVEADLLSATIVSGVDFIVGNQVGIPGFALGGKMGQFLLSDVERAATYYQSFCSPFLPPPVDANTQLAYLLNEGAGTFAADSSSNNYTGTLTSALMWTQ